MRPRREAPGAASRSSSCGAGAAAHLAGVVARAHDPAGHRRADRLVCAQGVSTLLSTVQMPPGVPVATVSIGKLRASTNAAVLAAQILGVGDAADSVLASRPTKVACGQGRGGSRGCAPGAERAATRSSHLAVA